MKVKEQKQILTKLGPVRLYKWLTVRTIVKLLNEVGSKVITKEWCDHRGTDFKSYPLDLTDIGFWSTRDEMECINIKLSNESKTKVMVEVTISKGGYDYKNRKEFKAIIILPNRFLIECVETQRVTKHMLNNHLEDTYDKFLAKQKETFINNLKTTFFNA